MKLNCNPDVRVNDPAAAKNVSPLVPVTKENVDAFAKNWEKWLPK